MKVNSIDKNSISFNGFYNSKELKKVLCFAEDNGALFASATALALSAVLKPPSILATPDTDKLNKKIACAKSITSTIMELIITLAVSIPVVRAVSKINKKPQKYLKQETIENLKNGADKLQDSNAYKLANQMFKLGIGIAIAAPKAILNVLGMPYVLDYLFGEKYDFSKKKDDKLIFRGKNSDKLVSIISKTINNKFVQEFSKKNAESNFPMHISAIKDTLTTSIFVLGLNKSNKIENDRKPPLIYNSLISTGLSIITGYALDSITQKPAEKFIKRLESANKNDSNLQKYIDGFKIAKPIVILGLVYYGVIPMISTFMGERISKLKDNSKDNHTTNEQRTHNVCM